MNKKGFIYLRSLQQVHREYTNAANQEFKLPLMSTQ